MVRRLKTLTVEKYVKKSNFSEEQKNCRRFYDRMIISFSFIYVFKPDLTDEAFTTRVETITDAKSYVQNRIIY